ncbi:survival factor 1 [Moniliophthora roreri]|nr:survival factor 1 [Moniliophthora roreri]
MKTVSHIPGPNLDLTPRNLLCEEKDWNTYHGDRPDYHAARSRKLCDRQRYLAAMVELLLGHKRLLVLKAMRISIGDMFSSDNTKTLSMLWASQKLNNYICPIPKHADTLASRQLRSSVQRRAAPIFERQKINIIFDSSSTISTLVWKLDWGQIRAKRRVFVYIPLVRSSTNPRTFLGMVAHIAKRTMACYVYRSLGGLNPCLSLVPNIRA